MLFRESATLEICSDILVCTHMVCCTNCLIKPRYSRTTDAIVVYFAE